MKARITMKVRIMLILSVLVASLLVFGCTRAVSVPVSEDKPFIPIVTVVEKTLTGATSVAVPQQMESHWIVLKSSRFMPRDVEVRVGDTVEWVNADDETYTFNLEGITGARLPIGGRTEYQFNKAGVYSYSARLIETHAHEDTQDRILHGVVLVE